MLAGILRPAVRKRGLAGADLIMSWPAIAGPQFASMTMPERILWPQSASEQPEPGVLVVRCSGPAALLVQHDAPLIIERANTFLGWYAIARLKIVQGPISAPDRAEQAVPPDLPAAKKDEIGRTVETIANDRLRAALARLGESVAARALTEPDTEPSASTG